MRLPRPMVRKAILTAAAADLRARGFQAASLADISRQAGLTKGAIFSNFSGKDELFLQILESHVHSTIERYREESIGEDSIDEALDHLASFLAKSAIADAAWSAAYAEFALHASRKPETGAELARVRRQLRHELIDLLRPLIDSGQADEARLDRAATFFFAISNGLTLESLSDATRVDETIYRDALERLLFT